jgi:hypothetical protein
MHEKFDQLLAYIVSSAAGCIKEPKIYGSLRLIDTAEKLIILFDELGLVQDEKLSELANIINEEKWLCMSDEKAFDEMLNNVSGKLAEFMSARGE